MILHELEGLTPQCLQFGRDIAAAGYSVALPLLFGAAGRDHGLRHLWDVGRREFSLWRHGSASPLLGWLRALGRRLAANAAVGPRIGVIGMGVTGAFALGMLVDDEHGALASAAVLAHPSLPCVALRPTRETRRAIALPPADLEAVCARAERDAVPVLGLRFQRDWRCPRERFDTLTRMLGHRFTAVEVPGRHHAVLTRHAMAMHPSDQARVHGAVLGLLADRLRPGYRRS